jgi:hypothetical protein
MARIEARPLGCDKGGQRQPQDGSESLVYPGNSIKKAG